MYDETFCQIFEHFQKTKYFFTNIMPNENLIMEESKKRWYLHSKNEIVNYRSVLLYCFTPRGPDGVIDIISFCVDSSSPPP